MMAFLNQRTRSVILKIEKQDAGSLLNKGLDDGLADPARAAGDKNYFPLQTAVYSGGRHLFHSVRDYRTTPSSGELAVA